MATGYSSHHRPNHSSEFRIGNYTNAHRLDFIEKLMSINVFHTIGALKSTIFVHVNYLSYTQDGVVTIYLCSKITDVTASHVQNYKHITVEQLA